MHVITSQRDAADTHSVTASRHPQRQAISTRHPSRPTCLRADHQLIPARHVVSAPLQVRQSEPVVSAHLLFLQMTNYFALQGTQLRRGPAGASAATTPINSRHQLKRLFALSLIPWRMITISIIVHVKELKRKELKLANSGRGDKVMLGRC